MASIMPLLIMPLLIIPIPIFMHGESLLLERRCQLGDLVPARHEAGLVQRLFLSISAFDVHTKQTETKLLTANTCALSCIQVREVIANLNFD